MMIRNLLELSAAGVTSEGDDKGSITVRATGIDIRDIQRRATQGGVRTRQICCIAWAIVLSNHAFQESVEFMVNEEDDMTAATLVRASVYADQTISNLLSENCSISQDPDCHTLDQSGTTHLIISPSASRLASPRSTPVEKALLAVELQSLQPKQLHAVCTYQEGIPPQYARTCASHFLRVLNLLTLHPAWNLLYTRDISLMSLSEEFQLRQQCQPRRGLAEMEIGSVHQLFKRQACRSPHNAAIEDANGRVTTYQQLDAMASLMAADICEVLKNVKHEAIETGLSSEKVLAVGIMLHRSPFVIVAVLACWMAGCAIVLVDPSQPASRNAWIIEDCRCALLIVDKPWSNHQKAWQYDFELLRERIVERTPDLDSGFESQIDLSKDLSNPAWFRTTSGSTGRPKCALLSHASLGASIASFANKVRSSRTLLFLNPISSASGNQIWSYLTTGGCLCIPAQADMTADLAGCITRFAADDICITPSAMSLISPEQVPSLKTVAFVGEATSRATCELWSRSVAVLTGYGATEMNSPAKPYHDEILGALPPAHVLPHADYSVYVCKPGTSQLCPFFVPGEICLSSSYMCSGYVGNPDATSKAFVPHPYPGDGGHTYMYRTGDMGMLIGNRRFLVLGRLDFQFKIDGNRVNPSEIESVVGQLEGIRKCKAILLKPARGRALLTCCVMLKSSSKKRKRNHPDWNSTVAAAQEACARELPGYMMPHRWLPFESLPETAAGKVDVTTLTAQAQHMINEASDTSAAEENSRARKRVIPAAAKIFLDLAFASLLGSAHEAADLSHSDRQRMQSLSFIANGATSLSILQLRNALRRQGMEVQLARLFSSKSLLSIAMDVVSPTKPNKPSQGEANEASCNNVQELPIPLSSDLAANCEAIFPATPLQREMLPVSMVAPKSWTVYQFFDLSSLPCSKAQLQEAIGILAAQKKNLRTIFTAPNRPGRFPQVHDIDEAFDTVASGGLFQAVLGSESFTPLVNEHPSIETPEKFWRQDCDQPWAFDKPLWRVALIADSQILAWTMHHAIIDEAIGRNISRDLYGILRGIQVRDNQVTGWQTALSQAVATSSRPSTQDWVIDHYGTRGVDGPPTTLMSKHEGVWQDFLAGVSSTPIPDDLQLPYEELPTPPVDVKLDHIPYGQWCRRNHLPAAVLFHTVNALTIARLLGFWRPDGPAMVPKDITYYRMSSNRASTERAPELEGILASVSPMKVPVSAESDVVQVAEAALQNWLATHESDPYYVDPRPTRKGPGKMDRSRPWGNVLFNHVTGHGEAEGVVKEAFPRSSQLDDQGVFAMVWPFGVLEMTIIEPDPSKGSELHLAILSTLGEGRAGEYLDVFTRIIGRIVNSQTSVSVGAIVRED